MPYSADKPADVKSMKDKLSKTYKGLNDKAVRQAIHVWNSVMDSGGDEGRAWASVYAKMNERGLKKKGSSLRDILASEGLVKSAGSLEEGYLKILVKYLEEKHHTRFKRESGGQRLYADSSYGVVYLYTDGKGMWLDYEETPDFRHPEEEQLFWESYDPDYYKERLVGDPEKDIPKVLRYLR